MTENREEELAQVLQEVRRIEAQSRRLVVEVLAGAYCAVFRSSGIEFDEVRDYVVGDDPRSVDWNVTARVGRPFVKKYVEERELTLMFLLDLSPSMDGGHGIWSARQAAARVAGCLALMAVNNDDKVGMIAFGGEVVRYVPPQKGVAHALRIIRDSLILPGGAGPTDLTAPLEMASRVLRRHAILFILSDFLAESWEKALALCSRRHDVIAVRILSPELEPPSFGIQRVRDPESGRVVLVDWRDRRTREDWQTRVAAWRARTENILHRIKVDLMDVPVPATPDKDAIGRPIHKFFRMRQLRGAKR